MIIKERLQALRALMEENKIDIYVVPSSDNHQSEYVGEHFKSRAFISGFTGSAGTAVITKTDAFLWTDGRYFLQAEQQLADTGFELCRMGNPGVLTISEFIEKSASKDTVLGFDGRLVSVAEGQEWEEILDAKSGSITYDLDLIDPIWENRPALSTEPAFALDLCYSGESTESKLCRIREKMTASGATSHIVTSLDDLCWIFNIRGNDVRFSPLVLGYAIIFMDSVSLFADINKFDDSILTSFHKDSISVFAYNDIYERVKEFSSDDCLLIDPSKLNYALYKNLSSDSKKIEAANPTILMKAMKNNVELDNIRAAHIKDGVAITKFMYWLKQNIGKIEITEMSASDKLEEFRAQQEGFLWPSFAPICAYKEHAAIVHYESEPETNVALKPEGLFLSDTGANYFQGSTDITRTFALGALTAEEKLHFTTVVRSMLALSRAKFLYGAAGYNLDIIARQPFWELDLNYNHGTGHGVGYLLNIHEGPTGFRWQIRGTESHPFEEGMVITDEPGIYIAGSHGIRIENELIVQKGTANEYGQFMYFEPVTFAPIDLDAIDLQYMTEEDKKALNEYHKEVYEKVGPYLTDEEQLWFKDAIFFK